MCVCGWSAEGAEGTRGALTVLLCVAAKVYHRKCCFPALALTVLVLLLLLLLYQAVSLLVERSGCDVRTAINTLQLLARQQQQSQHETGGNNSNSTRGGSPRGQAGSSQRSAAGGRVRVTAADIAAAGAFGVKDVGHTPIAVVQEVLAASSSRAMAGRLQQLAAAMRAEQQPAAAGWRAGRRGAGSRGAAAGSGPVVLSAAATARLQLQEHYSMLLDLGEHEQVGVRDDGDDGDGGCVVCKGRVTEASQNQNNIRPSDSKQHMFAW